MKICCIHTQKSKENTWVTERKEKSVFLQLQLQVAISNIGAWKEVLVPSETSLRDVLVAIFSCKSEEESLAEELLHNPHKKSNSISVSLLKVVEDDQLLAHQGPHTHSCGLETQHTCSLLLKQKGNLQNRRGLGLLLLLLLF